MNYTNNYHLPQWEKSDRVLMEDFNQMCRDMEAGLEKNLQDAASATNSAAGAASAAAAQAQSTANSALAKANAAQETANQAFSPSKFPYTVGTYTGNGSTTTLYLGFRPRFLILTGQSGSPNQGTINVGVVGPGGNLNSCVTLTSSGAEIVNPANNGTTTIYPRLNNSGQTYSYIAFQ